jgi:hypothetical protein
MGRACCFCSCSGLMQLHRTQNSRRRFVPRWLARYLFRCIGPNAMHQKRNNRILRIRSVICWLLCGALVAPALAVPATQADGRQAQIEVLHVPELDAGFHLLYELKLEEARAQFEAWQKSHPADPLGSASEAAAYPFEECLSARRRQAAYRLSVSR